MNVFLFLFLFAALKTREHKINKWRRLERKVKGTNTLKGRVQTTQYTVNVWNKIKTFSSFVFLKD